jgi:GNAT superfamily N-acetyltransferase
VEVTTRYRHTAEDSIYLAPQAVGRGLGGRLLDALLDRCADAGVRQVIAVIVEDDADASLVLHQSRFRRRRPADRRGFQTRPLAGHPAPAAQTHLSRLVMSVKAGLSL